MASKLDATDRQQDPTKPREISNTGSDSDENNEHTDNASPTEESKNKNFSIKLILNSQGGLTGAAKPESRMESSQSISSDYRKDIPNSPILSKPSLPLISKGIPESNRLPPANSLYMSPELNSGNVPSEGMKPSMLSELRSSSLQDLDQDHLESKRNRRFRRKYNQIVRKYSCSYPGCPKSYGSLNHLNTHIVIKKHGQRKSKADFHFEESNESPAYYPVSSQVLNQMPNQMPPQVAVEYGYPYWYRIPNQQVIPVQQAEMPYMQPAAYYQPSIPPVHSIPPPMHLLKSNPPMPDQYAGWQQIPYKHTRPTDRIPPISYPAIGIPPRTDLAHTSDYSKSLSKYTLNPPAVSEVKSDASNAVLLPEQKKNSS